MVWHSSEVELEPLSHYFMFVYLQYERRQLEGEIIPETADDFDRLVLQSPDSSLVWLRYMAFHLETSEIDKARAVAERALKTIVFR